MEKDVAYTLFSKIKIPDDSIAKRLAIILSVTGNRITVKKYTNREGTIYDLVAFIAKWNVTPHEDVDGRRHRKDVDRQKKATCSILFDSDCRILGVRVEKVNSPDERAQLLMRVNDGIVNATNELRFNEAIISLLYLFLDQKLTPDVKDFVFKTITEVFTKPEPSKESPAVNNKTAETK